MGPITCLVSESGSEKRVYCREETREMITHISSGGMSKGRTCGEHGANESQGAGTHHGKAVTCRHTPCERSDVPSRHLVEEQSREERSGRKSEETSGA